MPDNEQLPLSKLDSGQSGRVIRIEGGHGMTNRLNALNIRPSQTITKVSSMFMRGPVTVAVGNAHVAIGYGMARRIIVETDQ